MYIPGICKEVETWSQELLKKSAFKSNDKQTNKQTNIAEVSYIVVGLCMWNLATGGSPIGTGHRVHSLTHETEGNTCPHLFNCLCHNETGFKQSLEMFGFTSLIKIYQAVNTPTCTLHRCSPHAHTPKSSHSHRYYNESSVHGDRNVGWSSSSTQDMALYLLMAHSCRTQFLSSLYNV
jgi:hypothetical protein